MKLSEELRLRGVEVGDAYAYTSNGNAIPHTQGVDNSGYLERLLSGRSDEGINFLWLVDKDGNKKERIKVKLSEELKLRGAEVGDSYGYSMAEYGYTDTEVFISTYRVYSSEFLEDLLSGLYDKHQTFLWLVDKDGIKKEIIK